MGKRPVLTFSHVGIWVTDLETMRRFYTDVLGFVETDRGPIGDTELVFLSQSTGDHHQLVLAKGRPHDAGFTTVNQLSYKLDSLETLKAMYATIVHKPVKDLVQISHGNAWSIYFKDPNGLMLEYCCLTRELNENDATTMQPRFEVVGKDFVRGRFARD